MGRPDLTYLTQNTFVVKELDRMSTITDRDGVLVSSTMYSKNDAKKYLIPVSKLPELVQCAEMLFDMTKDKGSITHSIVSALLNELKQD